MEFPSVPSIGENTDGLREVPITNLAAVSAEEDLQLKAVIATLPLEVITSGAHCPIVTKIREAIVATGKVIVPAEYVTESVADRVKRLMEL